MLRDFQGPAYSAAYDEKKLRFAGSLVATLVGIGANISELSGGLKVANHQAFNLRMQFFLALRLIGTNK